MSALHYLHQRLIVHMDIKPENIMIQREANVAKIIDFGVSQIVEYPTMPMKVALAGTYRYMPPEQHNEKVTLKSDIWSFACVLFELCTGIKPFHGINEYALCYKIALGVNPLEYALENEPAWKLKVIRENEDLKDLLTQCFSQSQS